jgi:hypothetical protein
MNFSDIQKATDPKKVLEAYFGQLGGFHGQIQGMWGQTGPYSAKNYFNTSELYTMAGAYSPHDFYNPKDYFSG